MVIAELPSNEEQRLKDLHSYNILNEQPEADFDELVEIASQICDCPVSVLTLVDKDKQWFKARKGTDVPGTSRDASFCAHTILQDEVFVVNDATKDERFFDNPCVTGAMNIRFYAGAPIMSPGGYKVGSLCLIDHKPRTLTSQQEKILQLLSKQATRLLEVRSKNIYLRQRSLEIINLKTQSLRTVIKDNDADRKRISEQLHEDLAQSVASTIFYLNMAADDANSRVSLIGTAARQLTDILEKIRSLSFHLAPPGVNILSPGELLQELVDKLALTYPFKITVWQDKCLSAVPQHLMLAAMRTVETWLEILSTEKNIQKVYLKVKSDAQLHILIEDDADAVFAEREAAIFNKAISESVRCLDGKIELHIGSSNKLLFTWPLVPQNAPVTA